MIEYQNGKISVIVGPMFAGKSEELIKRVKRYGFAGIKTLVIKPKLDTRAHGVIKSRNGAAHKTVSVENANEILKIWNPDYRVVAIDEAQFFDEDIVEVATYLANKQVRVIISALDTDFEGRPFGVIPQLLAIAEKVTKLTAVCMVCGSEASMSYRNSLSQSLIEVGDSEYEARCRKCHNQSMTERVHEFSVKNL